APSPPGEEELQPRAGAADAAARYGIDLVDLAERENLDGSAGSTVSARLPRALAGTADLPWSGLPRHLLLLGTGDGTSAAFRTAGLALGRQSTRTVVTTLGEDLGPRALRAFVEGFLLSAYRMPRTASSPAPGSDPAERLVILGIADDRTNRAAVARARAAARATMLARTLSATPASTKNPAWLAGQAEELASATNPGLLENRRGADPRPGSLRVDVHDERWLRQQGMEAILAVGGGSATPPRLVVITWQPQTPARTVALVGKGITFDTGGLSLKPRDAMVPMKTDMAGAGTVLATVLAAAELGLPHRVVAVLPLAENAIGAGSYRPGDVVRTYDGTTVEVSNTDAEGRMVLADALGWAVATQHPDVVIDVATLTGAATLGLGRTHAALYSTDDDLAAALERAGQVTGEALWPMPLVEDYRQTLRSAVADVAHASTDAHVGAGSITAALFLQRFVGDTRWAHLDIAGAGRTGKKDGELPANAPTGFGARLLLSYLEELTA
ncbi:leucyl aminopeptidase, partial [Georgenia sp. 10Sc9-8]|nr:leucyl aminopeptidase [Georgenia halotolerans]